MSPLKPPDIDWNAYLEDIATRQEVDRVVKEMAEMSGRQLYEMPSYSNMASYLVNRPSVNAMHGTITNYPIEPLDMATNLLIDGAVYYKLDDFQHIRRELYVKLAEWDYFSDQLVSVLIGYVTEGGQWYYEHYTRLDDGCLKIVYKPTRKEVAPDELEKLEVDYTIEYPFFPFVGARWKEGQSFLDPPKASLIRLETAYRIVGMENTERRGLSLYIEGVRDKSDIQTAPRKFGRNVHLLPKDAKFHSPGSDAPGIELMRWEVDRLEEGIERSTGVVSTERLATLSGISRVIAEKPLIFLCEQIRQIYSELLVEVQDTLSGLGAPEPEVSYRSLTQVSHEEARVVVDILNLALDSKVITDEEYAREVRSLLNLHTL